MKTQICSGGLFGLYIGLKLSGKIEAVGPGDVIKLRGYM